MKVSLRILSCPSAVRWMLLNTAVALSLTCPASSAQDEVELNSVQRDQNRIGLRLVSLREKMDRLVARYEAEGRTRNAELLRAAIEQFDEGGLLDRSREIDRGLESAMLSAVGEQESLVLAMENIYSVLRDRRDVDELREQVDLLSEGIDELDRLASEQRRLLQETLAGSDTPAAVMDEAIAEVERLQRTLSEAAESQKTLRATEVALGEVGLAEFLADQQRALAADPQTTAADEDRLAAGVAKLLEGLQEPLDGAQGSELLAAAESHRARARDAVEVALGAMKRASTQLASTAEAVSPASDGEASGEAEGAEAGAEGAEGANAGSEASAENAGTESGAQADAAGASGSEPSTGASGSEGASDDSSAGSESGAEGSSGEESSAGQEQPSPGGSSAQQSSAPDESASATDEAAGSDTSEQSGQESSAGAQGTAAEQSMAEASEQLDKARDALAESERTLAAARNRAAAMAAASGRQAQAQAEDLKQDSMRLEAAEPEVGPELLDRTRDLMAELAAMKESLQGQDSAQAGQQLSAAEKNLNDILKQLRERRQNADDQPRDPKTPEQVAAAVADQQEVQRRLRELMDRLEELPDQEFQQPGQQADSAMDEAAEALEQDNAQEAATRQEEASEALDEAKKKLEGEQDRYEQLRQEEVLFRLGEKLQELLDEQLAASTETREIHEARGDRERLSRSHRRAVVRLSETERSLSLEATGIAEELSADGAKVFVFAIDQIAEDLESVADELADQETGTFVASLQQGIEQRLADLSSVLDEELERRRKSMEDAESEGGDPPEGQGGEGKQPLVPPVAELLLIQRMELMALSRIENFQRMHVEAAAEGLGEMELQMLERWALEHSKTTTLFESMVPKEPEVALDSERDSEREPERSPDLKPQDEPGGEP
ncbi:MAG: hypothetical protein ACI9EF_001105 [Pseudohongiellaceae bacterium]|jgi:hypothetical protein